MNATVNESLPFFPKITDFPPGEIVNLSPYHFVPTARICVLFVALFGLSTIAHLEQAVHFRLWSFLGTAVLCGVVQTGGWVFRLEGAHDPLARNPFKFQYVAFCLLMVAPTLVTAANFTILGRVVRRMGPQYLRIKPSTYTTIFLTSDVISLIVELFGSALAASSDSRVTLGSHVAMIGIIFSTISVIIYVALAIEFLVRYGRDKPVNTRSEYRVRGFASTRIKLMIAALGAMTLFITIRSSFRILQLREGGNGPIHRAEWAFNVFDGGMSTAALVTLNCFHPGFMLRGPDEPVSALEATAAPEGLEENAKWGTGSWAKGDYVPLGLKDEAYEVPAYGRR
ncbi:RTA1 like protein-domain-containing protein [Gloeopeniophorella convolvens]|nr:RTA1 like protein-domain-containing protein [Gloeopeniophorella convolvens]